MGKTNLGLFDWAPLTELFTLDFAFLGNYNGPMYVKISICVLFFYSGWRMHDANCTSVVSAAEDAAVCLLERRLLLLLLLCRSRGDATSQGLEWWRRSAMMHSRRRIRGIQQQMRVIAATDDSTSPSLPPSCSVSMQLVASTESSAAQDKNSWRWLFELMN